MMMILLTLNIIIYRAISVPVHGKNVLDGINARDRGI